MSVQRPQHNAAGVLPGTARPQPQPSACSDSRDALHLREDFPAKDAGKAYLGSQGENAKKYTSLPSLQLVL